MSYEIQREADLREVLEHFLRLEARKEKYAGQREEFSSCAALDDQAFLAKVRAFADAREDTNPVLVWTIGAKGNEHCKRVERWVLARVPFASVYSRGINKKMKEDLDESKGNLVAFLKHAKKYSEFRLGEVPEGDMAILFAVAKSSQDREGAVELLDGAHRALGMLANSRSETMAYVAELKKN